MSSFYSTFSSLLTYPAQICTSKDTNDKTNKPDLEPLLAKSATKEVLYCTSAVNKQDLTLLCKLIRDGADVNAAPEGNALPLEISAVLGNVEMTKLLLQHGAMIDHANKYGCTALLLAIDKSILPVAFVLLEWGADATLKSKKGHAAISCAKDDAAKSLLSIYLAGRRPSWLARELYQRGLAWDVIVAADAKMQKEGYSTREAMVVMSLITFTDAYLKNIGITSSLAREMIFQIRLESTWLGSELAKRGVNAANIAICELMIVHKWSRTSKESFAALLPSDLSISNCAAYGMTARQVIESLQELHAQLNDKRDEKNEQVPEEAQANTTALPVVPPTTPMPTPAAVANPSVPESSSAPAPAASTVAAKDNGGCAGSVVATVVAVNALSNAGVPGFM